MCTSELVVGLGRLKPPFQFAGYSCCIQHRHTYASKREPIWGHEENVITIALKASWSRGANYPKLVLAEIPPGLKSLIIETYSGMIPISFRIANDIWCVIAFSKYIWPFEFENWCH